MALAFTTILVPPAAPGLALLLVTRNGVFDFFPVLRVGVGSRCLFWGVRFVSVPVPRLTLLRDTFCFRVAVAVLAAAPVVFRVDFDPEPTRIVVARVLRGVEGWEGEGDGLVASLVTLRVLREPVLLAFFKFFLPAFGIFTETPGLLFAGVAERAVLLLETRTGVFFLVTAVSLVILTALLVVLVAADGALASNFLSVTLTLTVNDEFFESVPALGLLAALDCLV